MKAVSKARRRPIQRRTVLTHWRIINGAIAVLASAGVAGLTHRAVAQQSDVSLAATTYHFKTKKHILEAAAKALLAENLRALRRLERRIHAGYERDVRNLDDLVSRSVLYALDQTRVRSLAWCEIILNGGRTVEGRSAVREWFAQLDLPYSQISRRIDPASNEQQTRLVLYEVIGWIFLLHPLRLNRSMLEAVLSGCLDLEDVLARAESLREPANTVTRDESAIEGTGAGPCSRIIDAAVDVLVLEGVGSVCYRSVAERVNMVRSALTYYFPTIENLLKAAELALFSRAKTRYRTAIDAWRTAGSDQIRLIDVTAAILFREALEFGSENLGFYLVWLRAVRSDALRTVAAATLLDSHRAWKRRLAVMIEEGVSKKAPFQMQSIFVGMLIRFIGSGSDVAALAHLRDDLAASFGRAAGGRWLTTEQRRSTDVSAPVGRKHPTPDQ